MAESSHSVSLTDPHGLGMHACLTEYKKNLVNKFKTMKHFKTFNIFIIK